VCEGSVAARITNLVKTVLASVVVRHCAIAEGFGNHISGGRVDIGRVVVVAAAVEDREWLTALRYSTLMSGRFLGVSNAACVNVAGAKGSLRTLFTSRLSERQEPCECGFLDFTWRQLPGCRTKLLPTRSWFAIFPFRANFPNCRRCVPTLISLYQRYPGGPEVACGSVGSIEV
jgi:hypothetical protein